MSKSPAIIAIDGPSGTGKSTTARKVAAALGWTYLDTGAMYRAIAWVMEKSANQDLEKVLSETHISFDGNNQVLINNINRESEIREPRISAVVSKYSAMPSVRATLTAQQREIGATQNCVLDGRDIGTVVFPNAEHKFFLNADYKTRAQRRLLELKAAGKVQSLEEVERNLRERDAADSNRELAPLAKAENAIEIDTTRLTIDEQVQKVLQCVGVVTHCTDTGATTQGYNGSD